GHGAEEGGKAEQQHRRDQEQDEGAGEDRGDEIAPGNHAGRFEQAHHAASPSPASISSTTLSPAIATKASWRPERSIDNSSMPAPPSISAVSTGSIPSAGWLTLQKPP